MFHVNSKFRRHVPPVSNYQDVCLCEDLDGVWSYKDVSADVFGKGS